MALKDHPLMGVLALLLGLTALVHFRLAEMQVLQNSIDPFAAWIFAISLFGAYLLSQRRLGELSVWEQSAFVIGFGGYAGMAFVPAIRDTITANNPHAGVVLFVATMASFYVLTNENI